MRINLVLLRAVVFLSQLPNEPLISTDLITANYTHNLNKFNFMIISSRFIYCYYIYKQLTSLGNNGTTCLFLIYHDLGHNGTYRVWIKPKQKYSLKCLKRRMFAGALRNLVVAMKGAGIVLPPTWILGPRTRQEFKVCEPDLLELLHPL